MDKEDLLPFISNGDLYKHAEKVTKVFGTAIDDADERLHNNVIDPFLALFRALLQDIRGEQWLELEKARQIQKTMENAMGDFHQDILTSMPGWETAKEVVDIVNRGKKVIAEVKNKWNTTKGNHLVRIYDDLASMLAKDDYHGFIGYYVEVIPKNPTPYDIPFTPSDNETHTKRPENESIRVIDGNTFYGLASGYPDALRVLYDKLPLVINDILGKTQGVELDGIIYNLFNRAYEPEKLI